MDNELDFRVGDVVCDIKFGNGKVFKIDRGFVYVIFKTGNEFIYESSGKVYRGHPHRALYHGTWEQVFGNLPDLKPKRKVKRWANLYDSGEFKIFNDEITAKSFAEIAPFKVVAVAVEVEVDE